MGQKRNQGKQGKQEREPVATKERLARALYDVLEPGEVFLNELVERARAGYYDDYESPLAMPLRQLVQDVQLLVEQGRLDGEAARAFGERVIEGEFDGTKAESDAWMEREGGALLSSAFLEEDAADGRVAAADGAAARYLMSRLVGLFEYLVRDANVRYSNADMLMGLHNAHAISLLVLLDGAKLNGEMRAMILQSARDTFVERMNREIARLQ